MAVNRELPVKKLCLLPTWPGLNSPPPHLGLSVRGLDSTPKLSDQILPWYYVEQGLALGNVLLHVVLTVNKTFVPALDCT